MKLAAYLREKGISTTDFAVEIGVSGEAVRLYALGRRMPRREQMAAIVKATGGKVMPNDFAEAATAEPAHGGEAA